MINLARRRFPKLSFRTGDAEQLNFRDESFDAVVMNFGLHHLARPERALAESARVLRPGGCLACTVWALPGENVGHQIMLAAIEAHGRQDLRLPTGPPMFRFTDFGVCREALQRAGFVEPNARTIHLTWDLSAPYGVYDAFQAGGVRPAMTLEAQTPEALEKIREAVRKASESFRVGSRLMIPMAAVLVSGMRPENRDLACLYRKCHLV
jgi:ubiquinone/menaquinone biosynthesis C-methylase UbiE